MESYHCKSHGLLVLLALCCGWATGQGRVSQTSLSATKRFHFNVEWKTVTRLCSTKPLLTINGQYPGPTISVQEGDKIEIKVTNSVTLNTSIHWHGVRQMRTGWADGTAYITQCPIQSNKSYTYKFRVKNQRGTLFWHAHISWQRASIHGAFIIHPRSPYPFSLPIAAEITIILGEWWNGDYLAVEADIIKYGGGPKDSDAFTINGLPGPLYPCSVKDTFIQGVEQGKNYMLRIINAAISDELFFAIAKHTMTVVEIDATYVKPFTTPAIMIAPGQTTNVLFKADQASHVQSFPMAARPYATAPFPFDNTTTVGFITYYEKKKELNTAIPSLLFSTDLQNFADSFLPPIHDTPFNTEFSKKLRSLASSDYPCKVPKEVDKQVFLTLSLNLQDCPSNHTCKGFLGKRFSSSINNQSFVFPPISILESHYHNLSSGNLISDFPEKPPHQFNYTGTISLDASMNSEFGTKLLVVPYGTRMEFVLQDTSFISVENHPMHFHGYNFFIVGSGFGNFNAKRDPAGFNLVDPPERNTVAVPSGGWVAMRFKANNPGVWFMHCHIEEHTTWGLSMAFIVKNGPKPSQSIPPPPADLPSC